MKILYRVGVFLLAVGLLTACTASSSESRDQVNPKSETEVSYEMTSGEGEHDVSEHDEDREVVIGKIVKIYGNYIEINRAELSDRMLEKMQGKQTQGGNTKNNSSESGTNLTSVVSGAPGMPPGGGMRQGNPNRQSQTSEYTFTGNINHIMIPVGSAIQSMDEATLELTYDSLSKGMVIKVIVDKKMTEDFQEQTEEETLYADSVLVLK